MASASTHVRTRLFEQGGRTLPKIAEKPIFKRPRSKFWQVRWTSPSGTEHRCSAGTTDYQEAKKFYERIKESGGLSFQMAAGRFFSEHVMRPSTLKGYKTSFVAWLPSLGHKRMDQIKLLDLQKFVSRRLKVVKPGTIRNDLAFLSSLFVFVAQIPGGPEDNPVAKFSKKHLALPEERIRFLENFQVEALEKVINNPQRWLIVLFGLEAGLRLGEVLNLRVHQLDLGDDPHILLFGKDVKSKKGRRVPISKKLHRALMAHTLNRPNDLVFPSPVLRAGKVVPFRDIKCWWPRAVADAELGDFHFHDTRHHFAVWYVKRGGRREALQVMLGHSTVAMTAKYAYFAPGDAEAEFRRIDY